MTAPDYAALADRYEQAILAEGNWPDIYTEVLAALRDMAEDSEIPEVWRQTINEAAAAVDDNEWFYWQKQNDAESLVLSARSLLTALDERDKRIAQDKTAILLAVKERDELKAFIRDEDYNLTVSCNDLDAHATLKRAQLELARIVKLREEEISNLLTERDEWKAISNRMAEAQTDTSNMLDQLPDPDQPPHDLQADYRAWLNDFDKDLP